MSRVFLFPLLILSACASTPESRRQGYIDQINAEHNSQLRTPTDTPIADKYGTPEYRTAYAKAVCEGLSGPECKRRFNADFFSQLQSRYYAADLLGVTALCQADPVDCGLKQWESMAAVSHNEGIDWHRGVTIHGINVLARGDKLTKQERDAIERWVKPGQEAMPKGPDETDCTVTYSDGYINTHCE